jgi:hypothetical protein
MIQLANDPKTSRSTTSRPTQSDGKVSGFDTKAGRSGHAWPFLSRYAARPTQQDHQKPAANDSGS